MISVRINELFDQIDQTPFGAEERALVDQAVALAVESGDEQLEYQTRMRLTSSAMHNDDTETMLSSFAWCLAKHDSDPARFPLKISDKGADVMWQFKWMASTLSHSPIFSTEDINAMLDSMQEHYTTAGLGPSGVLNAQFSVAWRRGDLEKANELRTQILATPRDDYSHCDACVRSEFSAFLTELGREDEAIALVDEMVAEEYECSDEPEAALAAILLPYVRAGRTDDARAAHFRSYSMARTDPGNLGIIADHLVFCAVTGNEARGLTMIERHLSWLNHDQLAASGRFGALVAFGITLDAVTRTGHGDQTVRGAESADLVNIFGAHDGTWTVRDLAAASWAAAERIGAQFDQRNGNDYRTSLIAKAKKLASEHYDLPLSSDTFGLTLPVAAEPTDGAGWFIRADELAEAGSLREAIPAAQTALELVSGTTREEALSMLTGLFVATDDLESAELTLAERIAALRESGQDAQAGLEERSGLAMFGRSEAHDLVALERELTTLGQLPQSAQADLEITLALALFRGENADLDRVDALATSALANIEISGANRLLTTTLQSLASVAAAKQEPERALGYLSQLLPRIENRGALAQTLMLRASILGNQENEEEAVADADRACEILHTIGATLPLRTATYLAVRLYVGCQQYDHAATRLRLVLRYTEQLEEPTLGVRFQLGRALVDSGESQEALDILTGVYEEEVASDIDAGNRAETLYWMGLAFNYCEQHSSAIVAWASAAELYEEAGDLVSAARSQSTSAKMHFQFGIFDDAAALLRAAVANVRTSPDHTGLLANTLQQLGTAEAHAGDIAGLVSLDEALALAVEHEAHWMVADITDSKARALAALKRNSDAIAMALTAADRYRASGDKVSAANSQRLAAQILVSEERDNDALPLFRAALEESAENDWLQSMTAIELADCLDRLGRSGEAAAARAIAENASV